MHTDLQVVEVIVQQHSGIGDAFLGPHKDEGHHSLMGGDNNVSA